MERYGQAHLPVLFALPVVLMPRTHRRFMTAFQRECQRKQGGKNRYQFFHIPVIKVEINNCFRLVIVWALPGLIVELS